jgi:hypothetical protein
MGRRTVIRDVIQPFEGIPRSVIQRAEFHSGRAPDQRFIHPLNQVKKGLASLDVPHDAGPIVRIEGSSTFVRWLIPHLLDARVMHDTTGPFPTSQATDVLVKTPVARAIAEWLTADGLREVKLSDYLRASFPEGL